MPTSSRVLRSISSALDGVEASLAALPLRMALFGVLALVLVWPLLGTAADMNLFRDAQVLDGYEHHAVETVRRFGQLPLWDPYYCGGMYSVGSPQGRHFSPTFLLSLLFGHERGAPLIALAMIVIGLEGAYRYAVSRGASSLGAVLAAPIFAASGVFATAPQLGWLNFFGFELMPWAALGVREGLRTRLAHGALTAIAFAWMVGFGGTYAGPLVAVVCVFETLEALGERVRTPRVLPALIARASLIALMAVGLSLFRLLPIAETLMSAPRVIADRPGIAWNVAYRALTGELGFRGNEIASLDGFFLVGAWAIPAVLAGLFGLRAVPVALMGALAAWTATGYAAGWSPFVALRALPLFSTLRYPERYLIVVALAVCALAALGVTHAQRLTRRHPLGLLVLIPIVALLAFNLRPLAASHHAAAEHRSLSAPPERIDRDFQQARGNRWLAAHYAHFSRGSLSCWEAWPVPQSPFLRGDLPADEYLVDPAAGRVQRTYWSPNRIDLEVTLSRPARLRVNQNWHGGWRSSVGAVVSDDGLLSVDLPAGEHRVRLRFVPRSAIAGGLGSLIALGVMGWWFVRWRRGKESPGGRKGMALLAGSVAAPWVFAGVAWATIPETSVPYGTVRDILGNAIVVSEAPAGSQVLDVRFAEGVVLRAARVDKARVRAGERVTLELVWERTGKVSKGTGVFMHVVGPGGAFNLDHPQVSSTLPLSALPKGRLGRDIVTWTLPTGSADGTYEVVAGLWNPKAGGRRVAVVDAGRAEVQEHGVRAIRFEAGRASGASRATE